MTPIYVRAVLPNYAVKDFCNQGYSPWFVGHTDEYKLTDDKLIELFQQWRLTLEETAGEEMLQFFDWLAGRGGYIVFNSSAEGYTVLPVDGPQATAEEQWANPKWLPPAGVRDNACLATALLIAEDIVLPDSVMANLTDEGYKRCYEWAFKIHLRANDNDDVVVPPKPTVLAAYTKAWGE